MPAPPRHRGAHRAGGRDAVPPQRLCRDRDQRDRRGQRRPKRLALSLFPRRQGPDREAAVPLCRRRAVVATLEKLEQEHDRRRDDQAYCRLLAGWMAKSGFRDGCPISTTLLESAPQSESMAAAGREAFASWCAVIARALVRDGFGKAEARRLATLAVSAIEGPLILARVESSRRRSTTSQVARAVQARTRANGRTEACMNIQDRSARANQPAALDFVREYAIRRQSRGEVTIELPFDKRFSDPPAIPASMVGTAATSPRSSCLSLLPRGWALATLDFTVDDRRRQRRELRRGPGAAGRPHQFGRRRRYLRRLGGAGNPMRHGARDRRAISRSASSGLVRHATTRC